MSVRSNSYNLCLITQYILTQFAQRSFYRNVVRFEMKWLKLILDELLWNASHWPLVCLIQQVASILTRPQDSLTSNMSSILSDLSELGNVVDMWLVLIIILTHTWHLTYGQVHWILELNMSIKGEGDHPNPLSFWGLWAIESIKGWMGVM